MKKQIITSRIQIGTATILFLFIIVCLSVFALLSISDARSSLSFSQRHATFITKYYQADSIAQQWLRDVEQKINEGESLSSAITSATNDSPSSSSIGIQFHDTTINAIFSLGAEQEIQVTLNIADRSILRHELHNTTQYDIDQSLPVFTGE